ncbi:DUF4089 domain-containing protein [Falsiroseomonas selenitidurans]|uniref:DUF4089 domain-containing protein n=1 Tax=Falsiroseomonas selenitidurans TaxID=2716335 RepID=A0ABX1E9J5_9PROT|nr:DUF4089 domain-containing protein [Falsiroseomonas selenitidurans]NKC33450.1 DUF4089 domain-containing protein [Falsiroseomonas selenitidurans]
MTTPPFDAEAYARQAAPLLGLTVTPAQLPGVVANLQLAARMAAMVESWKLGVADEPAPVFVAR